MADTRSPEQRNRDAFRAQANKPKASDYMSGQPDYIKNQFQSGNYGLGAHSIDQPKATSWSQPTYSRPNIAVDTNFSLNTGKYGWSPGKTPTIGAIDWRSIGGGQDISKMGASKATAGQIDWNPQQDWRIDPNTGQIDLNTWDSGLSAQTEAIAARMGSQNTAAINAIREQMASRGMLSSDTELQMENRQHSMATESEALMRGEAAAAEAAMRTDITKQNATMSYQVAKANQDYLSALDQRLADIAAFQANLETQVSMANAAERTKYMDMLNQANTAYATLELERQKANQNASLSMSQLKQDYSKHLIAQDLQRQVEQSRAQLGVAGLNFDYYKQNQDTQTTRDSWAANYLTQMDVTGLANSFGGGGSGADNRDLLYKSQVDAYSNPMYGKSLEDQMQYNAQAYNQLFGGY